MTRRLKPLEIQHIAHLPCAGCSDCAFWETSTMLERRCGSSCDGELVRERIGEVNREWGECGRVAAEEDEILGFIKYAPARYFPQSRYFEAGPIDPDTPMLACIHIKDEARRLGLGEVLLKAALRDLTSRGEKQVMAYAFPAGRDAAFEPVIGVEFLLRNGFTVASPHPAYPLLKLDLRSLATWAENVDALLQALRIPLPSPQRMPSPSIKIKGGSHG